MNHTIRTSICLPCLEMFRLFNVVGMANVNNPKMTECNVFHSDFDDFRENLVIRTQSHPQFQNG